MRTEAEVKRLLKYLAVQPGLSDTDEGWEVALLWVLGEDLPTPMDNDIAGGRTP